MGRRFWLLGLFFLMLVGMLWLLNYVPKPTRASLDRPGSRVAPRSVLTCTTHTTGMTLMTSSTVPEVGDRVMVTVTLANEGCGQVGLPEYRLALATEPLILVPESPISVTHFLALAPDATDTVTFSLQTMGVGDVTLGASASFEVHLGYPGPAYWSYDRTAHVQVSVPMTDTEIVVLQQVAYEVGCFPDIEQNGNTYSFGCAIVAGHSVDVQVERFVDELAAQAEFAARQGTLVLDPFHCYPAHSWVYEQDIMPQRQAWHRWLAERWIFTVHSVDETGLSVAPAPVEVSGITYRVAIEQQLFMACERNYLPLVCKQ